LLGLYYLLGSASELWARLAPVLPFSSTSSETLRVRLRDSSLAIIAGTLLSAAVQGASIGLGVYLAGVPDALFWSVAAAIATLVPLVGNALVWFPVLVYTLVTRRYEAALAIGIFGGLAPPVIDRVVRATTSSRMGRVHPMITLVGAIAGMRVAGVAGLILGPVALAMFFTVVQVYYRDYYGIETRDIDAGLTLPNAAEGRR
jgi:predicted PurR-regulated permease PerM